MPVSDKNSSSSARNRRTTTEPQQFIQKPVFKDRDPRSFKEQKAPKLNPIEGDGKLAPIYISSLITASLLLLVGLLGINLGQTANQLLFSLLAIIIGGTQVIIDVGWLSIIKINRVDTIKTWKAALYAVTNVRGQKIFIFPVFIDFVVLVATLFFLLY
jgi:hypothetical protein